MIFKVKVFLLTLFIFSNAMALNKSRKIVTSNDEVAEVKTGLGIATKILLPDNPNAPPIIGDLGAYRIEMIDKGYAVKPIRSGAKTNLFISTINRPYTVKLTQVNQESADYIVYLVSREVKLNHIEWRDFKRRIKSDYFVLETKRIGKSKDGFFVLDFTLKSKSKNLIDPEWFYLKQGKIVKIIHTLFLSSPEIESDKPVSGSLSANLKDLSSDVAAVLFINFQEGLRLEIPREYLWRK